MLGAILAQGDFLDSHPPSPCVDRVFCRLRPEDAMKALDRRAPWVEAKPTFWCASSKHGNFAAS